MRLRHIELLHAVFTTGSLTGAAYLLNISQPAASKILQHAERQLGFALFRRERGRLLPTQEALLLRHRVDEIMEKLQGLQRLTANIARAEDYPLRVICTPALAQALIPDAVTALREHFPDTTVELSTQHSAQMYESLMLHEADIGLTLQDTNLPGLEREVVCQGHVMVIAPRGWWSRAEMEQPLPIAALGGQPVIGIAVQDALGHTLKNHLEQIVPAPQISVWVQTYQLAFSLVARGMGLALVDPFTASRCRAESVLMRPLKQELAVTLHAVLRRDSPLNPVQKCFIRLARRIAQRMLTSGNL